MHVITSLNARESVEVFDFNLFSYCKKVLPYFFIVSALFSFYFIYNYLVKCLSIVYAFT
jgi:hypothetical protein